jgi:hypothetical protein
MSHLLRNSDRTMACPRSSHRREVERQSSLVNADEEVDKAGLNAECPTPA